MAVAKAIKTKAYFKRFQVKFRRRREGKTDYRNRKFLNLQDKNKYNTPKYRLIVRISNKDVCAQIAHATMAGDKIISCAYAHELPRYGLKVGLTNYAACYCVGLLIARRTLQKFGLDEAYEGKTEDLGEDYQVEHEDDEKRPFKCFLDVGIARTSTGARIFGFLKGALDGGLDVPHSEKRFAGYLKEESKLDEELVSKYIFGGHVSEYMEELQEDEPEKYKEVFGAFIEEGLEPDDMEEYYEKVHEAIREDPAFVKKEKSPVSEADKKKEWKKKKLTLEERKANLALKVDIFKSN